MRWSSSLFTRRRLCSDRQTKAQPLHHYSLNLCVCVCVWGGLMLCCNRFKRVQTDMSVKLMKLHRCSVYWFAAEEQFSHILSGRPPLSSSWSGPYVTAVTQPLFVLELCSHLYFFFYKYPEPDQLCMRCPLDKCLQACLLLCYICTCCINY